MAVGSSCPKKVSGYNPWKAPLEILADAVDQALNATTALSTTLRTEAAFHPPVSDQKI
jgi:hypothetical protein